MEVFAGRLPLFFLLLTLASLLPTILSQDPLTATDKKQRKNATVEALKQLIPTKINSSDPTALNARESTFSVTYIPVFLIVVALIIIIGLYVYDVFSDIIDEGGVFQWTNDTISLHCSDTTTNQFRFLLAASIFFSVGLIILLSREWKYRHDTTAEAVWWGCDLVAAISFAFIGIFPTHGDTTRHQFKVVQVGRVQRSQCPDSETGCMRCSTVIIYKTVVPDDYLKLFCWKTCVPRTVSKWIHMVTAMYCMNELTVSNMVFSWYDMPHDDEHIVVFRFLSTLTLVALCTLYFIQGILMKREIINSKLRAVLYLISMGSELCTLLFAVIVTMISILHRDPKVLWIFSTCVGVKT